MVETLEDAASDKSALSEFQDSFPALEQHSQAQFPPQIPLHALFHHSLWTAKPLLRDMA